MTMVALRNLALAVLVVLAGAGIVRAEDAPVPQQLVLGYDNEGKIDASPQACLAMVKEMTQWDRAQTEKGATEVCATRKQHVEAYAALQATYKSFIKAFSVDRRLNLAGSVAAFKTLFKACMEHKFGLTTGGHNIRIDIIENEIATACLVLGNNLLKDETAKYNALLRQ
jgi:hypothetical protein